MLNGYLRAPRRRGTWLPQLAIVLLLTLWSITPMAAQASLPTDELLQTNIAGSFDGTRYDLLDDDARHNPGGASFSVSLWFKPNDLVSTQMLLQKGNTGSSIRGWSIFIENGRLIIRVNASNDATQRASTSVALGTTGQWQHVVGVVNRSTNRVVGYLNGSNANFSPGTGGPTSDSIAGFQSITTTMPLAVGATSEQNAGFKGSLQDLRLYARVLSAAEATALSQATPPASSLLGPATPGLRELRVFANGIGGYACYRIPAVVKLPNNDLLAFAEGRVASCDDFGNMDIVMRRSSDNGVSWGTQQVVAQNGAVQAGNPGVVVDTLDPSAPNGRIWLVYNTSSHSESQVRAGTGVREVFATSSANNGTTWSTPVNITTSVHRPKQPSINPAYNFVEDWRWNAILPGSAIQLRVGAYAGRLFFAANHTDAANQLYSHGFWSDDHGQTWALGGTVGPQTNEATAVELSDGRVMINMRNYNGQKMRAVAISSDGGATWPSVYRDAQLPDPVVQASIERFTSAATLDRSRLLFSNPNNTSSRVNMTVRVSYDEGATWAVSRSIRAGASAYSDVLVQGDMRIGLLYEHGNGGSIYYASTTLRWLSQGSDTPLPVGEALLRTFSQRFDGATITTIGSDSAYNPGSSGFSVSIWLKPEDIATTRVIAQKGNLTSTQAGWSLFLENGQLIFRVNAANSASQRASVSVPIAAKGQWLHFVGVVDRGTSTLRGYLNASPAQVIAGGGGPTSASIAGFPAISSTSALVAGARTDHVYYYLGMADDLRLYNRVLTLDEIAALAQNHR